jgi:hypothetical protein
MGKVIPQQVERGRVWQYAVLAAGAGVFGLLVLSLMLWNVTALAAVGLVGQLYYVTLIPLGISVALVLFGCMKSYAAYKGKPVGGDRLGGVLELGGPIVGFGLTVVLGFLLPARAPSTFPLTVYAYGDGGRGDLILRSQGSVILDLGADRRSEPIGANGQAYFPAVPSTFRMQSVTVLLDAPGYERVDSDKLLPLDGDNLYIDVRRKSARIAGRVQDETGSPLPGIQVHLENFKSITDSGGEFQFQIPGAAIEGSMSVRVDTPGFVPYRSSAVPSSNDLVIILKSQHRSQ